MYQTTVGDHVVIEDVQTGSRDVIGLVGTVKAISPGHTIVTTPFSERLSVDVVATQVRPA